jgi:hypothetical protein
MVAGNKGVQFLDLRGHAVKAIQFSAPFFSAIDRGLEIWSYGSRFFSGADDSVAGDIDGDGRPEFAVAVQIKIHLINRDGREIWSSHDLNIWHLEVLPASGGEPGKILHSNARGELVVQDPQGILSVFDEKSRLVYQEVLDENCGAVASALGESNESLFVGCEDKIFDYSLAACQKNSSRIRHYTPR